MLVCLAGVLCIYCMSSRRSKAASQMFKFFRAQPFLAAIECAVPLPPLIASPASPGAVSLPCRVRVSTFSPSTPSLLPPLSLPPLQE